LGLGLVLGLVLSIGLRLYLNLEIIPSLDLDIIDSLVARLKMNSLAPIFILAKRKGLSIRKSYISGFWSVALPNGNAYSTKSTVDMIAYVKGY